MQIIKDFRKNVIRKDRKYHLKTYEDCFVAQEAVDYLVESGAALTRKDAVELGFAMQLMNVFDHVVSMRSYGGGGGDAALCLHFLETDR